MTTKNTGGDAFPRAGDQNTFPTNGMSLRDWFAGQVLAGDGVNDAVGREHTAERAYAIADAMIAEREK